MFDSRPRSLTASLFCGPWARLVYPSLVLVQPRKTGPCLTERLLMGRRESNQTNKQNWYDCFLTATAQAIVVATQAGTDVTLNADGYTSLPGSFTTVSRMQCNLL